MGTLESSVRSAFRVLCALLLLSLHATAAELRFRGPFGIPNTPRVVTVHAGDVDGNGKLDLIASNGSGTVLVFLQDTENRKVWTSVPVRVGASCFFTRAGDFDGDGFDDLAVADSGSTTYYVRSRGDGTFDAPVSLRQARGARWIAVGDWNKDGILDLASSNLSSGTLTIFVHDGEGNFRLTGSPPSHREHTLEALDYDGDGNLDLAMGTGLPGIQLHQGQGDGTFRFRGTVPGHNQLLGCVEYIAVGDFNNDGMDDMAPTCIDDQTAYAGISLGNARYRRILRDPFAPGTESSAVGDMNGDGNDDLALVSNGSTLVRIYLGKGDGTFDSPVHFGNTGNKPVFLIAEDLDADGHLDLVSADNGSSGLTVFYGREGEQFLESSQTVSGYGTAKDYALEDFDKDGLPDFFYADSTRSSVNVYLKPGVSSANRPSFTISTASRYSLLEVVDLNGDGILDLLGGNTTDDTVVTALLDIEGNARSEQSMQIAGNPKAVAAGHFDDGPTMDIATICSTADELATFLGRGDGTFVAGQTIATAENPKGFHVGDIDRDGRSDVAVVGSASVAIHYGLEGGGLAAAEALPAEESERFKEVKLSDLDGDGRVDVLVTESRSRSVLLYKGKGPRAFEEPRAISLGDVPPGPLEIVDIDRDGRLDIAVGNAPLQVVALLYNLGADEFSEPRLERAGVPVAKLRLVDVDGDRVNDIVAFGRSSTGVSLGVSDGPPPPPEPTFHRGDADGDGKVAITDAVSTLNFLFQGTAAPSCPDAADANDDGDVNLTDPVSVLNYLFQGARPPAAPGPNDCGEDPTPDSLPECTSSC